MGEEDKVPHAGLPPSQQLTSYKAFDKTSEQNVEANSESLYANIPASGPNKSSESPKSGPNSPLPKSMPPPSWDAQGTQDTQVQQRRLSDGKRRQRAGALCQTWWLWWRSSQCGLG